MARACKCDRCGDYYDYKHLDTSSSRHYNGIAKLDIDYDDKYYVREAIALCPQCREQFEDWLGAFRDAE